MSVLLLADAKTHLNITGTTPDVELQAVIDSAEAAIVKKCGPLASTATSVRVRGCTHMLALPVMPAISLTSVTPRDGSALTLSDLYLNTASAVVTYNDGSRFPATYYDVVYSAGRTTCPDDLLFAVKELVRHLWQTQRGLTARTLPSEDGAASGAGYLLPNRVLTLIGPHTQPGFA